MKIKWIESAKADVREIKAYIKKQSPKYAKVQVQRIFDQADKLKQFPFMGTVMPEYNDENSRYILLGAYRIIYFIASDKDIHIVRVWHTAKDFDPGKDLD
jgi:toxin ParE1/3/4